MLSLKVIRVDILNIMDPYYRMTCIGVGGGAYCAAACFVDEIQ